MAGAVDQRQFTALRRVRPDRVACAVRRTVNGDQRVTAVGANLCRVLSERTQDDAAGVLKINGWIGSLVADETIAERFRREVRLRCQLRFQFAQDAARRVPIRRLLTGLGAASSCDWCSAAAAKRSVAVSGTAGGTRPRTHDHSSANSRRRRERRLVRLAEYPRIDEYVRRAMIAIRAAQTSTINNGSSAARSTTYAASSRYFMGVTLVVPHDPRQRLAGIGSLSVEAIPLAP